MPDVGRSLPNKEETLWEADVLEEDSKHATGAASTQKAASPIATPEASPKASPKAPARPAAGPPACAPPSVKEAWGLSSAALQTKVASMQTKAERHAAQWERAERIAAKTLATRQRDSAREARQLRDAHHGLAQGGPFSPGDVTDADDHAKGRERGGGVLARRASNRRESVDGSGSMLPGLGQGGLSEAAAPRPLGRMNSANSSDDGSRLRLQTSFVLDELDNPSCLSALPDGNLCVADTGNHRLVVVSEAGEILREFGKPGSDSYRFRGPRGLVTDGHYLFVADCFNCRVKKLRLADGALLSIAGGYGSDEGQLRYPHGLALGHGCLYVGDCHNARIVVLRSSDLSYKFSFALKGPPGQTATPERSRRRKAPPSQGRGGESGKEEPAGPPAPARPDHSQPAGMALLGDELFVCDPYNRRIQVFLRSGVFRRFLSPRDHLEGAPLLKFPEGISTMDTSHHRRDSIVRTSVPRIFVSDKAGEAVHILSPIDGALLQMLPFLVHKPHGLTGLADDGLRVWVVDEMRNEIMLLAMGDRHRAEGTKDSKAEEEDGPLSDRKAAMGGPSGEHKPKPTDKGFAVCNLLTGPMDGDTPSQPAGLYNGNPSPQTPPRSPPDSPDASYPRRQPAWTPTAGTPAPSAPATPAPSTGLFGGSAGRFLAAAFNLGAPAAAPVADSRSLGLDARLGLSAGGTSSLSVTTPTLSSVPNARGPANAPPQLTSPVGHRLGVADEANERVLFPDGTSAPTPGILGGFASSVARSLVQTGWVEGATRRLSFHYFKEHFENHGAGVDLAARRNSLDAASRQPSAKERWSLASSKRNSARREIVL